MKISLQVLLTANQLKRLKGGFVGYDAGKKIKGKKRHILVDTQGLLIKTFVTAASLNDKKRTLRHPR